MKQVLALLGIFFFVILGIIFWYLGTHRTSIPSLSPTSHSITNIPPTESVPSSPTPCTALTVISPQAGGKASSPLSISIIVDNTSSCHWTVFEAQAGIAELRDSNGTLLGRTALKTNDDWTLQKPTPYNGMITYTKTPHPGNLTLVIHEENPSGKPNPQVVTVTLAQ